MTRLGSSRKNPAMFKSMLKSLECENTVPTIALRKQQHCQRVTGNLLPFKGRAVLLTCNELIRELKRYARSYYIHIMYILFISPVIVLIQSEFTIMLTECLRKVKMTILLNLIKLELNSVPRTTCSD